MKPPNSKAKSSHSQTVPTHTPELKQSTGLTRRCLEILAESNCRIQIITKSNLVARDDDLLKRIPSTVAFTITTDDDQLAKILEPNAPSPSQRLSAARRPHQSQGIPVSVRIDPIIPHVNDQPQKLIKTLASMGVKHITTSTYKVKPDNWNRLSPGDAFGCRETQTALFQGGRTGRRKHTAAKGLPFQAFKGHPRFG